MLGLLDIGSIPIFEEATQTAAHFLDAPICVLGLIDQDYEWIKAAIGLSRLGLMNPLAASRQIPYTQSLSRWIVEAGQPLAIPDTAIDSQAADSLLVTHYRIRSFLGVPVVSTTGCCLGALAVMDLAPRSFTPRDIELLELIARWSMSEFERHRLTKLHAPTAYSMTELAVHGRVTSKTEPEQLTDAVQYGLYNGTSKKTVPDVTATINSIKISLLTQMTQELRTPLTSVMGMASVLVREVYGALTAKQKEYLTIIHQSGQYLLSLVNEMIDLADLEEDGSTLNLAPVDIEMLCQQAMNMLEQAANRQEVALRLTLEPGNRIYLLDRVKVRHLLYHLMLEVIQTTTAGSEVRMHGSRRGDRLQVAIWVHNPWLGDGLPAADLQSSGVLQGWQPYPETAGTDLSGLGVSAEKQPIFCMTDVAQQQPVSQPYSDTTAHPGFQLSRQLAIAHGGDISIQGTIDSGYRYVLSLPCTTELP
jgi:signal transduction histidine kinase